MDQATAKAELARLQAAEMDRSNAIMDERTYRAMVRAIAEGKPWPPEPEEPAEHYRPWMPPPESLLPWWKRALRAIFGSRIIG